MNELRCILNAEDKLNDVDLTLNLVNSRDFISAVRQIGTFWAGVNESPPGVMRQPN